MVSVAFMLVVLDELNIETSVPVLENPVPGCLPLRIAAYSRVYN
jgi:hypothetical protein